jgi:hypothetical protein
MSFMSERPPGRTSLLAQWDIDVELRSPQMTAAARLEGLVEEENRPDPFERPLRNRSSSGLSGRRKPHDAGEDQDKPLTETPHDDSTLPFRRLATTP